ncbi:acyl carrier protein [Ureaplasma ceti]|uniref:Carrier domain-containing protein n=1 Tax=Ureaplasma ceti TaxID=3119530 RepID=A0ABP9U924_9BACT
MEQKVLDAIVATARENNIKINPNNRQATLKDIGLDSLAMMDLIFKVEEKLNVRLDDEVLLKIKNLEDLINAFQNCLNK